MNEIIFQTLVSTPTGVGASTGKHTEEAFNGNFSKVKTYLDALFNIASITVTSEQITQLKVDTTTTPYSLYYTMDPLDTDPSEVTWYDLDNVAFADLQGNPTDNIALADVLNSKASASDVSTLTLAVTNLSNTVGTNTQDIATNTANIGVNTSAINTLRDDAIHYVHTPTSDGTLYMRYNPTELRVEYSQDNAHWYNIASGAVTFADIGGSPTDNNNLVSYVTNAISTAVSGLNFVSSTDFNLHVNNHNNPHEVTKAQVGLGNVDNTADLDKPIPTAMQEEVARLWARYPEIQVLGIEDYWELFSVDVEDQAVESQVAVVGESLVIADEGTFVCAHHPVAIGSVTITDDYLTTFTVNDDNEIVDSEDNVVGYFTYSTGVVTSTGLEVTSGSINYSYILDTIAAGGVADLGHRMIIEGSVELVDGVDTYTDDGNGHLLSGSTVVANINYVAGTITSITLVTSSSATVSYSYESQDAPEDILYFTSSTFNGTQEVLNPNSSTYATKGYVDGIVGDINTVLSSLTTD